MRTELEEKLATASRDCELIRQEVSERKLENALEGMNTVIRDLTEWRNGLEIALDSHKRPQKSTLENYAQA